MYLDDFVWNFIFVGQICLQKNENVWIIDDNTTNIVGLFEAIEEDLKCLKKDPTTNFDVTVRIRGGEKNSNAAHTCLHMELAS